MKLAVRATGGAVSYQSAARVWGFERGDSQLIHVTLSRTKRSPDRPWLVTHTTNRPLRGLTVASNGIEVTRPLRTLLDVAGGAAADDELEDLFAHLVSSSRRGSAGLAPPAYASPADDSRPGSPYARVHA